MKLNSVVYALPVPRTLQTSAMIQSAKPVKQLPVVTDPVTDPFRESS